MTMLDSCNCVSCKLYVLREKQHTRAILRVRAEVLAACLKKLREHEAFVLRRTQKHDDIRAGELMIAISAIQALAPTGSDLEKLLRQAESRGVRWAEGRDIGQTTARISELEKARASEEKP